MSCALQGDSKYTGIGLHYGCSMVSKLIRQNTAAKHWIGFESQSDYPSTWEKAKIFNFLFDLTESADVHLCRGVRTLLEEGPSDPLGFHRFLPVVTVMALFARTRPF